MARNLFVNQLGRKKTIFSSNEIKHKKRVFLAIPLPEDLINNLKKLLTTLPGKKVPPEHWHFTLQFMGEIENEPLERLNFILSTLNLGVPFSITLGDFGAFPDARSAKVLWIGVREGVFELNALANKITKALSNEGFEVDTRPYTPHLTLSRFFPPRKMSDWIKSNPLTKGSFRVKEIVLYESILSKGQGPAQYVPLTSYCLR